MAELGENGKKAFNTLADVDNRSGDTPTETYNHLQALIGIGYALLEAAEQTAELREQQRRQQLGGNHVTGHPN
jgi:hypothetical protein